MESRQAQTGRGKPVIIGSATAEIFNKDVGDSLQMTSSIYRIVGIYQTGDAFEDAGAIVNLKDAQDLLGKQRQVSLFYIRLKDQSLSKRFIARVERQWPDIAVSGLQEFADKQALGDMLNGYVWAIGGLAIVIGGVGMMNSQLMSIMERTREIGVLRAIGWSSRRILWMILMESITVCLLGGVFGIVLGYLIVTSLSSMTLAMGVHAGNITAALIQQSLGVVLVLGITGGLYPAWRASRLEPVEALRYEGGSSGDRIRRLPIGGMAIQSLWQRSFRTLLTLSAIGLTVGAIMAIEGIMEGFVKSMEGSFFFSDAEIMLRQADIADSIIKLN